MKEYYLTNKHGFSTVLWPKHPGNRRQETLLNESEPEASTGIKTTGITKRFNQNAVYKKYLFE